MAGLLNVGTMWEQLGSAQNFIRYAGISGALAVMLAAYGSHGRDFDGRLDTFKTANLIHFYHSLALLAVPFCHRPSLVSVLNSFRKNSLRIRWCLLFNGLRAGEGDSEILFPNVIWENGPRKCRFEQLSSILGFLYQLVSWTTIATRLGVTFWSLSTISAELTSRITKLASDLNFSCPLTRSSFKTHNIHV